MPVILTCTDGSLYAPSIYQHAAWAAARLSGSIEILHVIDHHREHSPIIDISGAIGFNAAAELTEELVKLEEAQGRVARLKGKAILEDARRQLANIGDTQVSVTQRHGSLIETLEELEPHAELVVVGKRGEHAGAVQSPLGSNLEDLVRISVRPVLVASRLFKPIQRFLIAFDNSPSARKAVAYAAESPLLRGLECHLVMVGRADAAHSAALEEARAELTRAGHTVAAKLKPGKPAPVLAATVTETAIDLLVMGAYGHSHIREFIVGSTTTQVVRSCAIPVLMLR
ncbi:MAG: universal stress protein [Verrucomicrobia bacterium]|nr:universal stress protein [Verrucomicrobiota bacterium]